MRLAVSTASLDDPRVAYSLVHITSEAAVGTGDARRPVNLALVIDRSSSMRGPRLAQAVRAVRKVVDRLDARDRLTVITFDATTRILLPPGPVTGEARAQLHTALATLDTGAGTNLGAALKKAGDVAAAGFVREAATRMVLLTDGLPSVGVRDPVRLAAMAEAEAARGVVVTAMGIGEGFDDELLAELARCGKGGFYYLATPEAIPAAFGRELQGVFALAAADIELKVVPEPEVGTCEIMHRLSTRPVDDGLIVEVGEIAEAAPRQVLLRFVGTGTLPPLLARIAVTWTEPGGDERRQGHVTAVNLSAKPRPDERAEVAMERLRLMAATAIDEAWARRASGHRAEALAALAAVRAAIDDSMKRTLAPRAPLDALAKEIAATEEGIAGATKEAERLRRAARERSHITMRGHSGVHAIPKVDDDD